MNININTEKTFDNFVVGKSNEFAYKVCKAVTKNLNKNNLCLNPIFIFGDTGLGKTHLMNAICNELNKNNSNIKIKYTTANEFTDELISSVASRNKDEFNKKLKTDMDILIIDDIQFISGRSLTQEDLYNIINTRIENKKQVILTANKNPYNIRNIAKTLYSRLSSGLIAEITYPEYEIKYGIIKNIAKKFEINIPEEVIAFLSKQIIVNNFQLQCIANSMCANCKLCNLEPTVKLAEEAIKRTIG